MTHSTYAITGASGSLGTALTHTLLAEGHKVRAIARNEHRLHALRDSVAPALQDNLRIMCGDVTDRYRMARAFSRADYVIHAAAMKSVPQCEYDPGEAVEINIGGTQNVADACLDVGVKRAVFISSDKACSPHNLYGMTKATGERLWLASNRYSAGVGTEFVAVRYGNCWGTNGSVILKWLSANGSIKVTDPEATRFHFRLPDAVAFVLRVLASGVTGSLYVPQLPTYRLGDLASCFPEKRQEVVGLVTGEKLHELMVNEHEARHAVWEDGLIRIDPSLNGTATEEYKSSGNWPTRWRLSIDELKGEIEWLKQR